MRATTSKRNSRRKPAHPSPRTWVLQRQQPVDSQLYSVLRNGRQLRVDLSGPAALAFIRNEVAINDRVLREYPDGYRREITNRI